MYLHHSPLLSHEPLAGSIRTTNETIDHEPVYRSPCGVAQCRARCALDCTHDGTRKQPKQLSRCEGGPGDEGTHQ